MLEVRRQTGTNTVKVVEDIQKKLDARSRRRCPRGVKIDVVKEQATYIKDSVAALEEHLVLGSSAGLVHRLALHPRLAHGADQLHRHSDLDHHHVHRSCG